MFFFNSIFIRILSFTPCIDNFQIITHTHSAKADVFLQENKDNKGPRIQKIHYYVFACKRHFYIKSGLCQKLLNLGIAHYL